MSDFLYHRDTMEQNPISIRVYMVNELATLEWVSRRTICRNKDQYARVLIPFWKKGKNLVRYLLREDTEALRTIYDSDKSTKE